MKFSFYFQSKHPNTGAHRGYSAAYRSDGVLRRDLPVLDSVGDGLDLGGHLRAERVRSQVKPLGEFTEPSELRRNR